MPNEIPCNENCAKKEESIHISVDPALQEPSKATITVHVDVQNMTEVKEILVHAYQTAGKFIEKVESGRARSKETYSDLKKLKEMIEQIGKNRLYVEPEKKEERLEVLTGPEEQLKHPNIEVMGTHPQAGKDNIDLCKYRASKLHGREYREELTKEEENELKEQGIVVIFGSSDDSVELRGYLDGEVGGYCDSSMYLTKQGLFELCEENCIYSQKAKENTSEVKLYHLKEGYTWIFEAGFRHEEFDILEDGEKFCRGIVFHIDFIR